MADIYDFYNMSLPALKTALYIDGLMRGEEFKDYESYLTKVRGIFSELSKGNNIRKASPPVTVTLMDFLDPKRERISDKDYEGYLKKQAFNFARDLGRIKKLSDVEKKVLIEKCCKLHNVLLYHDIRRDRRMGMAA